MGNGYRQTDIHTHTHTREREREKERETKIDSCNFFSKPNI